MAVDGHSQTESDAVCSALVADLAHSTVPTSIMGCTLVGIAIYAHASTGMNVLLAAGACGGLASMTKVALMQTQKRLTARGDPSEGRTRSWKAAHTVLTSAVAASVGGTAASIFLQPDLALQMLATGLIFGYCSGVVSRVGTLPEAAITALLLAAGPPIIAAATWNDPSHHILVAVFAIFLVGSLESVRHVHRTAVRHVSMRLEMAALAQKDPLTGLANRVGLRTAFRAIGPDEPVAVFCLDLDGFKRVNDRYGHAAGDALLRLVAERLSAIAAPDATAVRMGGDEFVILKRGIFRRGDLLTLAERITTSLSEPFPLQGDDIRIGASVGHAASPFKPTDLDGLITRADGESYRIKSTRTLGTPADRPVSSLRNHG